VLSGLQPTLYKTSLKWLEHNKYTMSYQWLKQLVGTCSSINVRLLFIRNWYGRWESCSSFKLL